MTSTFSIDTEDDHIRVRTLGDKDIAFAQALWPEVVAACDKSGCYRILGCGNTAQSLSTMDAFDHAALFEELGIDARYRIAWVEESASAREMLYFAETVLFNRGVNVRLFDDDQAARAWLFEEQ